MDSTGLRRTHCKFSTNLAESGQSGGVQWSPVQSAGLQPDYVGERKVLGYWQLCPPRNPRNILEAADGSDDDLEDGHHPPSRSAMDVDDKNTADDVVDVPEEDDKAELDLFSVTYL